MTREWRLAFCMSIRLLDGWWNHDSWFEEDHFAGEVRFGISLVVGVEASFMLMNQAILMMPKAQVIDSRLQDQASRIKS